MRFYFILTTLFLSLTLTAQTAYWAATYKNHIDRGSTVLLAKQGYTFERTRYDLYLEKFYARDDSPPDQIISYADRRKKVLEGRWEIYYDNGQLQTRGRYQEGEKSNKWYFYREDGELWKICTYSDGGERCELQLNTVVRTSPPIRDGQAPPLQSVKTQEGAEARVVAPTVQQTEETIYKVIEEMPRYPGCEDIPDLSKCKQCAQQKLLRHVYSRVYYPLGYDGPLGVVVVTFVIEKDGAVTNARIARSLDERLDQISLDVVNSFPNFVPGRQKGELVRTQFNLPIKYQ